MTDLNELRKGALALGKPPIARMRELAELKPETFYGGEERTPFEDEWDRLMTGSAGVGSMTINESKARRAITDAWARYEKSEIGIADLANTYNMDKYGPMDHSFRGWAQTQGARLGGLGEREKVSKELFEQYKAGTILPAQENAIRQGIVLPEVKQAIVKEDQWRVDKKAYENKEMTLDQLKAKYPDLQTTGGGVSYDDATLAQLNESYRRAQKYYQDPDVSGWMPKKYELKFKDSFVDYAAGDPVTKEDIVRWRRGYFTKADYLSTGLSVKEMMDLAKSVSYFEGWKDYEHWGPGVSQYEAMSLEDAKKLFKPNVEAIARGEALPDDLKDLYNWYLKNSDDYFLTEHDQKPKEPRPYERGGGSVSVERTQADLELDRQGLLNEFGLPKAEYLKDYYGIQPGANITQRNSETFDYYATLDKYAKETGTDYWLKQSAGQPISKGAQGGYSKIRELTNYKPFDGTIDVRWLGKFGSPYELDTGLQNIAAFKYKDSFYDMFGRMIDLDHEDKPADMPEVYTAGMNLDQMIKRDQEALKSGNMTGFSRPTGHNYFSVPGYGELFNQSNNSSNFTRTNSSDMSIWTNTTTSDPLFTSIFTSPGTSTRTSEKQDAPYYGIFSSTTTTLPELSNDFLTTTATSKGTSTISLEGYEEEMAKVWKFDDMVKSMLGLGYITGSAGAISTAPAGGAGGVPAAILGGLAGGLSYNAGWLTRNYAPEFTKTWKFSLPAALEIPVPWGGTQINAFKDLGLPQSKLPETIPVLQKDWDLSSVAEFFTAAGVLGFGGRSQIKKELKNTKTTANVKIRDQGVFNEAGASEAVQRIEAAIESKNLFKVKRTTLKAPEGLGPFNVKEGSLMTDLNLWDIYKATPGKTVYSQAKGLFIKQSKGLQKQTQGVFIDFLEKTKPGQRVVQDVKKLPNSKMPREITTWETADLEGFSPSQLIGKDRLPIREPVKLKGTSQQVNRAYPSRSPVSGEVLENPLPNQPIMDVNAGRGQVFIDEMSVKGKPVPGKIGVNYDYVSRKLRTNEPLLNDRMPGLNPEDIAFDLKPKTRWKPEKTDLYHKDLWVGIVNDARKIYGKPYEGSPRTGSPAAVLKDFELTNPAAMESKAMTLGAYGHQLNIRAMSAEMSVPYLFGGIGAFYSPGTRHQKKGEQGETLSMNLFSPSGLGSDYSKEKDIWTDKHLKNLLTEDTTQELRSIQLPYQGTYTQITQKPRILTADKAYKKMRESLDSAGKQTLNLLEAPTRAVKTNTAQKNIKAVAQKQASMQSLTEVSVPMTQVLSLPAPMTTGAFTLPYFDMDSQRRKTKKRPIKYVYWDRYFKWGNLIKITKSGKIKI